VNYAHYKKLCLRDSIEDDFRLQAENLEVEKELFHIPTFQHVFEILDIDKWFLPIHKIRDYAYKENAQLDIHINELIEYDKIKGKW
jgi:hypothetical protein